MTGTVRGDVVAEGVDSRPDEACGTVWVVAGATPVDGRDMSR